MIERAAVAAECDDEALVGGLLTVLRMFRAMERVSAGVSPQQYRILKLIGAGGERSARLAEKLAVARPTLTSTADSLVAAGLAVRQAEPGDRRVVRLCLTEAGQAAVRHAEEAYAGWFGSLLGDTGCAAEILADLRILDETMTERHRAWHASAGQRGTGAVSKDHDVIAAAGASPDPADATPDAAGATHSAGER